MISGFGTYTYLSSLEECGRDISTWEYIKKRLAKILPQYYTCLCLIIFITPGIGWLNSSNLTKLLESIFLVQNFDPYNGVNGVTWTVAVLIQLYVFSPLLYKCVKKWGGVFCIFSIAVCIVLKNVLTSLIVTNGWENIWRVVVAIRIPITTFDLIVIGMLCAHYHKKHQNQSGKYLWCKALVVITMIIGYPVLFSYYSRHIGLYGETLLSNGAQSFIGAFVAVLILLSVDMPIAYKGIPGRFIQFMAKHEYGIYLWHMVLMGNISNFSPDWYVVLNEKNPAVLLIVMLIFSIVLGTFSNCFLTGKFKI